MRLSIIVPVYNTRAYVAKCLDSLLVPELGDYEIIAVNDGSTAGSETVLKEDCERYAGIVRMVETPNGGLGHARNTGLEVASGEFVLFVDSDDWLTEGAVQEMLDVLDDDMDVAVFDIVQVDENGRELKYDRGCEYDAPFTLSEKPEYLFSPHNAVNKLWRRTLFTGHGIRFPDRTWFEDLATTPKLFLHSGRIVPVHRAWYCYLQRRGSIMQSTGSAERNGEMIGVAETVLEHYRENDPEGRFRPQLEYKFFYEEFLAAIVRANRLDVHSPVQEKLRDDYIAHFPRYRENPYVRRAPLRYHLLDRLIRHGDWRGVHTLMAVNFKVKGR